MIPFSIVFEKFTAFENGIILNIMNKRQEVIEIIKGKELDCSRNPKNGTSQHGLV
jgi:hypothetical protein